jgi:hypothetical protein
MRSLPRTSQAAIIDGFTFMVACMLSLCAATGREDPKARTRFVRSIRQTWSLFSLLDSSHCRKGASRANKARRNANGRRDGAVIEFYAAASIALVKAAPVGK